MADLVHESFPHASENLWVIVWNKNGLKETWYINPFSIGKMEKLDFWDANNSTNINNLRTTNAKPINLRTIRKLIKYSLKTLL